MDFRKFLSGLEEAIVIGGRYHWETKWQAIAHHDGIFYKTGGTPLLRYDLPGRKRELLIDMETGEPFNGDADGYHRVALLERAPLFVNPIFNGLLYKELKGVDPKTNPDVSRAVLEEMVETVKALSEAKGPRNSKAGRKRFMTVLEERVPRAEAEEALAISKKAYWNDLPPIGKYGACLEVHEAYDFLANEVYEHIKPRCRGLYDFVAEQEYDSFFLNFYSTLEN